MTPKEIYDPALYINISYDDLVTYALFSLLEKNRNPTFENLVEEAFTLFPSRFHLIGHSDWPDSALINKSWLRCRSDKKYITGDIARGFSLTPIGVRIAENIYKKLKPASKNVKIVRMKGDARSRAGKFIKHIEKSGAFKLFKLGNLDLIKPLDFYELIFCTPDSLPQTRRENLAEIKQYLELYNRDDLQELFQFCEKKFFRGLEVKRRGGMISRKGGA